MTHDEMIVQSEAGKLAEKFLDENYPEDASDWLVIELAHYFLDFVEMELQEQREKVAAWMMHSGYSTGHGDTIEELLDELKDQVKKSPHDEG